MKRLLHICCPALVALALMSGSSGAQTTDLVETAKTMTRALGPETCRLLFEEEPSESFEPEVFSFTHKAPYDDEVTTYKLVRVPCWLGAYNQGDAYVLFSPHDTAELVSFAVPEYDVKYEDPETEEKLDSVKITGYSSRLTVVLSHFDAEKLQISEYYKSRGIGDAGTSAIWSFRDGRFGLLSFELDATYDGEINPNTLVEFGEPQ